MASKWRKEAHVFFAATVMFPDFCADKTVFFPNIKTAFHEIFQLRILGNFWDDDLLVQKMTERFGAGSFGKSFLKTRERAKELPLGFNQHILVVRFYFSSYLASG